MKGIFSILLLILSVFIYAQQEIYTVTPEKLALKIQSSKKPSIVQFWVPNCENNIEVVERYKILMEQYGTFINFYFVGITNKEDLVQDLMMKTDYNYNFYIIDKSISPEDLNARKETFNKIFTKLFSARKKDFITGYFAKENNSFSLTNRIKIRESKIKKLIAK